MANDCWNKAIIRGDEEVLNNLFDKFNSVENGILHIGNYKSLFTDDFSDLDEQDWGSKRFTPSAEIIGNELIVTGDSAWTPMIGLFEMICAEYGLEGELEYEEMGYDFAGKISWDTEGVIKENFDWTYWEKLCLFDKDNFLTELEYRAEIYASYEEFIEELNLDKWKDSSIINFEEVKEIWNKYSNED